MKQTYLTIESDTIENLNPTIPEQLYSDVSNLYDQFISISEKKGDGVELCNNLYNLLPERIKTAPVWKDQLTKIWRYEYGKPYTKMKNKMDLIGTDQFRPVEELYYSIKIAYKHIINTTQLLLFRKRLSNEHKHIETMFEMRPLNNLISGCTTEYEVLGYGEVKKSIDWLVSNEGINYLFDVKHRRKSFITQIGSIDYTKGNKPSLENPQIPNPEDLFKSTLEKFENAKSNFLQGVWITTSIKEDKKLLEDYFTNKLDSNKIQFVIISDWKSDALILTRYSFQKELLKDVFTINESNRFVTQY